MNPKRFWGKDMSEALRAVRSALGPGCSDHGYLQWNARRRLRGGDYCANRQGEPADELKASESDTAITKTADPFDEVRQELAALKSMLGWLAPGLSHKEEIFKVLLGSRTRAGDHRSFGRRHEGIQRGHVVETSVYRALSRLIPSGGQIRQERDCLALIGPTGVGKTTGLDQTHRLRNATTTSPRRLGQHRSTRAQGERSVGGLCSDSRGSLRDRR